jgi:hypothetical protein
MGVAHVFMKRNFTNNNKHAYYFKTVVILPRVYDWLQTTHVVNGYTRRPQGKVECKCMLSKKVTYDFIFMVVMLFNTALSLTSVHQALHFFCMNK